MWNPIEKLKKKFGRGETAESKAKDVSPEMMAAAQAGVPDMKELEKKGMLGQFFRRWKDPAFLRQIRAVAARMQAEGVNVKDQAAVKAWLEAHQKEIASGELQAPSSEPQKTFVKTGPDLGRNEPCSCGSGKKYKKCCAK